VFVPLSDDNALRHISRAYVTVSLILFTILAFVWQVVSDTSIGPNACRSLSASFAVIPSDLVAVSFFGGPARGPCDAIAVPEILTLVTYAFLHGDPIHLAGNMLFLWVFGDNVEDALGHARFLVFYLLSAAAGALAHVVAISVLLPGDRVVALIGASGAVAGVVTAYLMLYPHVRVWVLAFRFIPLRITALWALGAWVGTQFVMLFLPSGQIAWWAHIGGIAAGAALVIVLRRPGVTLFNSVPAAKS
jgi:membrane associated rhomboid family serine protease